MITEKDYCDKDLSATLIEMGFSGFGHFYYEKDSSRLKATHKFLTVRTAKALDHTLAVSLYEAQKFLMEEKEVYVTVIPEYNEFRPVKGVKYRLEVTHWKDDEFGYETIEWLEDEHIVILFDYCEEALLEGIKEAIKILKMKN